MDLRPHLSPSKVSKTLGITNPSVKNLIQAGELTAVKISIGKRNHYRITAESFENFLKRRTFSAKEGIDE